MLGRSDAEERETVSESKGLCPNHLWAVTILAAATLLSLTYLGRLTSLAATDSSPAVASESETETDENIDDAQDASDQDASDEVPAEGSDEKEVAEETGRGVEVDPEEEETQSPPVKPEEGEAATPPKKNKRIIGATTTLLEKQSGLLFRARVDTGSKSCSLHVEEMVIEKEAEKRVDNIGKVVRFKVKNRSDETHWLEGRIDGYVIIKTADTREPRYKVPLTLRWKGIEKKVLVTLNNRTGMEYPLLLGRNFLRGDFLVDVAIGNDD
jgi:hypothetical protein